jgi:hypothetical protein
MAVGVSTCMHDETRGRERPGVVSCGKAGRLSFCIMDDGDVCAGRRRR